MFLTSFDVLRPIAGSGPLVVQKSTDAQLFRGRAIPASPVASARCLVAENTVEPVTVIGRDRWIRLTFSVAVVRSPGVIATLGHATVLSSEYEAVWTVE